MSEKVMKGIVLFIVVSAFGIGFSFAIKTWFLGNDESDYEIICLGGHEYYRANFMQKGFMAIRLTDDGRPVQCQKR